MSNNIKRINLPALPSNWSAMTWKHFQKIEKIKGKFASKESYLTHCFLAFEGLKPLRYAERWRSVLGSIPLIGRIVAETGRQVADLYEVGEGDGLPLVTYRHCFRFSGFWNALFGERFFIDDQEVLSFLGRIDFLYEQEKIRISRNPVQRKKKGIRKYVSHYTNLADMSWIHYRLCCMHIQQYAATKNTIHLDRFLSVLYKPEGRISRWMERLTGNSHPNHFSRYFSQLEINLILIFWETTQRYYKDCFRHLFKSGGNKKQLDYMKEEAEITVFLSKEIGTVPEKTQQINAFYCLQYLEDNAIIAEQREKELNRIRNR